MAGTEYITPVCPWQADEAPVILRAAAGSGFTVTANEEETGPSPHPVFVPLTVTEPDEAEVPNVTSGLLVPDPEVMIAPAGNDHT